ncbi:major facilitator superfamily domain-containing protein [Usnea florida]
MPAEVENEKARYTRVVPSYTWRFWAKMAALGVKGVLVAIDGTVTSTALRSLIKDLQGGDLYIWVINGYFLTCTAFQPFFGQTAIIFGRRWLMLTAVTLFTLGSGVAGGAWNMPMLIAGRVVRGIGDGGIQTMIQLSICDLVPLRELGNILAVLFAAVTIGTSLGPFVGGTIIEKTTWRWVFYIRLVESTWKAKMKLIDSACNAVFVTPIVAILTALAFPGTLLCLVFLAGHSPPNDRLRRPRCLLRKVSLLHRTNPAPDLFANRASAGAFVLTFVQSILYIWVIYLLPLRFQGILGSSPSDSGVQLLPTVIVLMPFAAASGAFVSKYGRYRLFHHIGFALMAIGLGCFTLFDATSSTALWVCIQATFAAADTATATGTWAFLRSFGILWGISIPTAVFNSKTVKLFARIVNPATRALMADGQAYQHATAAFIENYPLLKLAWKIAVAFAVLGFVMVFMDKQIKLRMELGTEYGIKEPARKPGEAEKTCQLQRC